MATTKAPDKGPTKKKRKKQEANGQAEAAPPIVPAGNASLLEQVKNRTGYRLVTWQGRRWHYYFCGLGADRVRKYGFKPYEAIFNLVSPLERAFGGVQAAEEAMAAFRAAEKGESIDPALSALALEFLSVVPFDDLQVVAHKVFYTGICIFYPNITLDDILLEMSFTSTEQLMPVFASQMISVMNDVKQSKGRAPVDSGGKAGGKP